MSTTYTHSVKSSDDISLCRMTPRQSRMRTRVVSTVVLPTRHDPSACTERITDREKARMLAREIARKAAEEEKEQDVALMRR